MQKIVVNRCYGGFGLSLKGEEYYLNLIGKEAYFYKQTKYAHKDGSDEYVRVEPVERDLMIYTVTIDLGEKTNYLPDENCWYSGGLVRNDPNLIKTVEALGKDANGWAADLEIVEIPDGVKWEIEEYDGKEWISEVHQTW